MSNVIINKHKLVLIHIPKCGGSSIRKTLGWNCQFQGYIPKEYMSYHKLALCRHPVDRFKSLYRMFKFGTTSIRARIDKLTIDTAIDILYDNNISHILDKKGASSTEPFISFKHHGIPITHPYNCINYADTIIRYENYEKQINSFFEMRQIENRIQHHNKSKNKMNLKMCKTQLGKIKEYYKEDFERFGYK